MTNIFSTFRLVLLHLIFICSISPLFGQLQYENQIIERIDIVFHAPSAANCDPVTVTSRMQLKEGALFSQTEFDSDLKVLAQEFDRVDPSFSTANNRMLITLHVYPKPIIRSIVWSGNEKVKSARLQKELALKTCSVFDRLAFIQAFNKVKAYYLRKGFFEAELDYQVNFDELTNEVDITITIIEGRSGKVQDIIFRNFTACEEDHILEQMLTKKYSFLTSWLSGEGAYNEEMMQQDRYNMITYLQNQGYADAQVEIEISEAPKDNRILIFITADKGSLYQIDEITFEGNTLFSDETIRERFTVCTGSPFSPEQINKTRENILNLYGRRGYIDAVVDYETRLTDCDCVYSIHFTIEEGKQYHVGLIKVFGNCSTETTVILHETLLVPGEVFNLEKLKKTEERLTNIGYFEHVNVYSVETESGCGPTGRNYRDVHIEVEETTTGNFGAFFGFSTVESIFGGINISERNFNYKGLTSFWKDGYGALRGGGESAQVSATIGNKSRSYEFSWTKPHFLDSEWSVGFDFEKSSNRYIAKDYDLDSSSFGLFATYDVNAFLKFSWHYRIKNSNVIVRNKNEVSEEEREDPDKQSLLKEARNDGIVSATGVSLIYDSTDNPIRPSNGLKSKLEGEFAGLGGRYHFFSAAYLNSSYFKTDSKGVLKFRADFRFIFPVFGQKYENLPLDERLFLGGDNTVRGYRPYRIGPRFASGDPRGGLSMQLFSAEYIRRITKRFDGFLFMDAGHLSSNVFDFGRLNVSAGYGVRFQVFEKGPPLTVGMGYPLNAKHKRDIKRFFFMIGGKF